jgi:hypothetical protein
LEALLPWNAKAALDAAAAQTDAELAASTPASYLTRRHRIISPSHQLTVIATSGPGLTDEM